MNDSWLDDAIRNLPVPPASRGFSERTLARLRARSASRRARWRFGLLTASALTFAGAVLLAVWPSEPQPSVTEEELKGLRAEIRSLRREMENTAVNIEVSHGERGTLRVDMDALFRAGVGDETGAATWNALVAVEGGEL
ncbi:MAG: hypothetical protein AAFP04_05330 [Myxococcota bacterium]